MDAPALTPERRRELDDLRARAYGPRADIHSDEHALARLHELEDLARTDLLPASTSLAPAPNPGLDPAAAEAPVIEPASSETPPAQPDAAVRSAPVRPWWRRIPLWAVVGVGAIVLAVAFVIATVLPPNADASLRVVANVTADDVEPRQMLGWFNVDIDTVRRHEEFHGVKIWSAGASDGSRCLMFSVQDWADGRCVPVGLDPVVDMMIYPGMPGLDGLDLPVGSVVRLALHGDVVDVSIAEAQSGTARRH
ncbi:hypothetical protein [Microbacterium pygmaeum]|nr:hypothetical protein [Microbacterium pygmaeum]